MGVKLLPIFILCLLTGKSPMAQSLALGDALRTESHHTEAIQAYQAYLAANPGRLYDSSIAWLGIAQSQTALGQFQQALWSLEQATALRTALKLEDKTDIALAASTAWLGLGNIEAATSILLEAKTSPSAEPNQYALIERYLANVYYAAQDYDAAAMHYEAAMQSIIIDAGELQAEVTECLYRLAGIAYNNKAYTAAKALLFRAVRIEEQRLGEKPWFGPALLLLGLITQEEQQYAASRSYLQYALTKLSDRQDLIQANIALSNNALGLLEIMEAEKNALTALEILYPSGQTTTAQSTDFPALAVAAYRQYARVLAAATHIPDKTKRLVDAYNQAWALSPQVPDLDLNLLAEESFSNTLSMAPEQVLSWMQFLTGNTASEGLHYYTTSRTVYGIFKNQQQARGFSADAQDVSATLTILLRAIQQDQTDIFIQQSSRLFQQLMDPIWPNIKPGAELAIYPHGFLKELPFEVLLTASVEQKDYRKLPYLIKNLSVRYPQLTGPTTLFGEEQTALLTTRSARYLSAQKDARAAVHLAKLDLIKKKETAFPRCWSGYILP